MKSERERVREMSDLSDFIFTEAGSHYFPPLASELFDPTAYMGSTDFDSEVSFF